MEQQDRLHSLDAVRAFALLLGIVLHATMSFWPGFKEQGWPIVDNDPNWTTAVIFYVIHISRMTLFFVVAGFFARLVFHRKGASAFVKDRAKRIAAPLVVGWVVCGILIVAVFIWAMFKNNGGVMPAPPTNAGQAAGRAEGIQLTHLWFLYYLLVLYAVVIPIRSMVARVDPTNTIRVRIDRAFESLGASPVAPLLLGAPIAAVFYFLDNWMMWSGIPTPDRSLVPQLPAMVGFGTAFTFGWLLHRQPRMLRVWEKRWPLNLAVALALTVYCLSVHGMHDVFAVATTGPTKLIYAISYSLAIWTWVFAILGVGMKFFAAESPRRRYVADSSYWLYIAHLPLVFALQVLVMQWSIHWSVKFAFILVVSYSLLFLTYHYWVRSTYLGEVLNGRKYPRTSFLSVWRSAPADTQRAPANNYNSASEQPLVIEGDALGSLRDAKKSYGATVALDGINLKVRRGELLAVLGPNGAGKSTAIALMLGLQQPSSGTVELFGQSPNQIDARRRVGVMMQEVTLAPELTVREHIDLTSSYYPSPLSVDATIAMTRISEIAGRRYRNLSGGQKRQVQFAMAVCGRPQLLFLDEPTVGLDVQAREAMWQTIRVLLAQGCSIVLTTHYLEEAETLADRVIVVNKGRVIASGTVADLRSFVSRRQVSCTSKLPVEHVSNWAEVAAVKLYQGRLSITTTSAESVVRRLLTEDASLTELEVRRAGLSDVFAELTQETA